jgi:predicted CxxxxCH...CXXCH cytochrome family protein
MCRVGAFYSSLLLLPFCFAAGVIYAFAYVTGDECLFCHRDIGPTWPDNRHQLTVRAAAPDDPALSALRARDEGEAFADETQFLMGAERVTRFLKRSEKYGQLDLLSMSYVAQTNGRYDNGAWRRVDAPDWDKTAFADRCAGCHATAVDVKSRAFSAVSLDCFVCHGDVPLEHSKDVSQVLLSDQNCPPREVVSICGQCHLRGGKSRSSGLPYPNTFVAGDNLFRDFQVDFSDAAINALTAVDRHVYQSARDVVAHGQLSTTCLTCHNVHGQHTENHQQLEETAICATCHLPGTGGAELQEEMTPTNRRRTHSAVCDY